MASNTLVTPKRGDPFTDKIGVPLPRPRSWIEEVSRRVNQDFTTIGGLDDRIKAIEDFIFKVIQFKSADYALLVSDSGVVADSSSSDIVIDFPEASLWLDQDKFVENAGSNTVSIELFGTEQVSGVDVILISPNTPYPVAKFKSNGPGLTLLSDRNGSDVVGAVYWETQLGEQMETQLGEKLAFRV